MPELTVGTRDEKKGVSRLKRQLFTKKKGHAPVS